MKDDDARMKDWILRYAEQSSDEDDGEEGEGEKTSQRNPELDEKFDPVSLMNKTIISIMVVIGIVRY